MKKAILVLIVLVLAAGSAHAWTALCDGCGGVKTCAGASHEQMAQTVMNNLSCLRDNTFNALDAGWADTSYSKDGSGVTYESEEYKCVWNTNCYGDRAHMYDDLWPYGCAEVNALGFFNRHNYRGWYWGGYVLARGLHFVQDAGNPYHTSDSIPWTSCQPQDHAPYEGWVNSNWVNYGFRSQYEGGVTYQISYSWPSKTTAKDQLLKNLAATSRQYWDDVTNKRCADLWTTNRWATSDLMWYAGAYSAAYVRGGQTCP